MPEPDKPRPEVPGQLELFGPPPHDKRNAIERAARVAGITPAELAARGAFVDPADPTTMRPPIRRKLPPPLGRRRGGPPAASGGTADE